MTDPFAEIPDDEDPNADPVDRIADSMSRLQETTTGDETAAAAETVRQLLSGKRVCPYCGHQSPHGSDPCPRCTMEDTPATRQATKARIGPWFVLQSRNPAAPGMKYATLLALINKGHVTPRSIVRGPTTHQMWRYAAHVRGISREFGLCFSCGGAIDRGSGICPHCQRSQDAPSDPDVLLETRQSVQPPQPLAAQEQVLEAPSYAARMRELSRQRAQAEQQSALAAPPRGRGEMARRPPGSGGRVVSAMQLAAALQDEQAQEDQPPKRRLLKAAAILILLAGGAGAALLYFKPEYRQPTYTWLHQTWATIKEKASSIDWQSHDRPAPPTGPLAAPQAAPAAPAAPVAAPQPARQTPVAASPAEPTQTAYTQPAAAPATHPTEQLAAEPAPQPAPMNTTAAIEQARVLWNQAIDAEARRDFAGAVKYYEQIKRLPLSSENWPGGLQVRLELAQRQAGQSAAQ
jgi:hypothetical protein